MSTTVKLRLTGVAAVKAALPSCVACTVHVPTASSVALVPLMPHTRGVCDASVTGSPDEADTLSATVPVTSSWSATGANVIVCGPVGVTGSEGSLALDVPSTFTAVAVKVYAVPLVSPVTTQLVAGTVITQLPPGAPVTVYDTTGPPVVGGVIVTVAVVWPATAVGTPGRPGRESCTVKLRVTGVAAAKAAPSARATKRR